MFCLNTGMKNHESIRQIFAKAVAAMPPVAAFPAPYAVTLKLDPSAPGGDILIDQISMWARCENRIGRSRRIVHAAKGEVLFEFESAVDAVECKLRYG